jgi:hypothetical protein
VNHKVKVVEKHPVALAAPFDGVGIDAKVPLEAILNLVGDCDGLLSTAVFDYSSSGMVTVAGRVVGLGCFCGTI